MILESVDILDSFRKRFRIWQKKRGILSKNPHLKKVKPDVKIKSQFTKLWAPFGKPSIDWLKIYAGINGVNDFKYTPESIYYTDIEPRLNNRIYSLAYADKNSYNKLIAGSDIFPKTFLRKINGVLYDEQYNYLTISKAEDLFNNIPEGHIVIKPSSESAGGRGVLILHKGMIHVQNDKEVIDFHRINTLYQKNFIIQQRLVQHPFFNQFNTTSVNTIRIFTYRSVLDNRIHILHCILRAGRKGSIIDNQAAGGASIGINDSGVLNNFAINKYGVKSKDINGISLDIIHEVPCLEIMQEQAMNIAQLFYYNRLLAFDFCLDENSRVRLLEVNLQNIEINFLQMNNGPLFGDFTEEIINFCRNAPKSIKFDFYV